MQKVKSVLNFVDKIFLGGGYVAILLIMVLTTFDLLARKLINFSIPSLYEFTEDYLMVSLVFLTLSYVYRIGGHVRITLLEQHFPPFIKKTVDKMSKALAFGLFLFIGLKGWNVTVRAYELQEVSSSVLAYPMAPALLMVPLGSALLCIRIFQSLFTFSEAEESLEHSAVD